eukprot:Tamp_30174.p1 GENE.Tamp_30174~~Tamp_30174.p1  ORF type:complete len:232 (-),score=43.31 Tamp_30174:48-743(-)
MLRTVIVLGAVGIASCAAFAPPPGLPHATVRSHTHPASAATRMLFNFGNRQQQPAPAAPPQGRQPAPAGLQPTPGKTVVTFNPGGTQIYARPGDRIGDIANRAGFNVPYGCREGVCGTCEAKMKQPTGQAVDVRICKDAIPKTNMDCPDREKMWGDLRGGKKSIGDLSGAPMEITIVLQNPTLALKRQRTWEEVKDNVKNNQDKWLDPNYKGSNTLRRNDAGQVKKKGWFS